MAWFIAVRRLGVHLGDGAAQPLGHLAHADGPVLEQGRVAPDVALLAQVL
jgi:hypothetical protein